MAESKRQRTAVSSVRQRETASRTIAGKGTVRYDAVELAELTTKARKKLPKSAFAIPETESYPIHDAAHARNALVRVSQFGTPSEKARVRAAVSRKYPAMGKAKKSMPRKGGK